MQKLSKKYYVLFFIILVAIWIAAITIDTKNGQNLLEEYPRINNKDEVRGIVKKIKKIKGGCFITTETEKFHLSSGQNYEYKNEYLHHNLFVGDSIIKNQYSDTIFIISSLGMEKYFVHNKVINRPNGN